MMVAGVGRMDQKTLHLSDGVRMALDASGSHTMLVDNSLVFALG